MVKRHLELKMQERQQKILPMYHQVAVQFADLHDTAGRMRDKNVIQVGRIRARFFVKLIEKITTEYFSPNYLKIANVVKLNKRLINYSMLFLRSLFYMSVHILGTYYVLSSIRNKVLCIDLVLNLVVLFGGRGSVLIVLCSQKLAKFKSIICFQFF